MSTPRQVRSPAFQFYADDFLAGTLVMDQADVGAYIRLLCHQWSRGSIPAEAEKQQRLAGGSVSADVLAKFRLQPDGRLVNERMEQERQKQAAYREMQAEKGRASAKARRNQPEVNRGSTVVQPSPQPEHQPNTQPEGNSPVSSLQTPSIEIEREDTRARGASWPTLDDVLASCSMVGIPAETGRAFWEHFEAQGWQTGNGLQIVQWTAKLSVWWRKQQAQEAEAKAKAAAKPQYRIGTATPADEAF